RELGLEYQIRIIEPAVKESVKVVMAQYNAEELITKREEVKNKIEQLISNRLETYGLVVTDLAITDLDFGVEFNKAIEEKVVAQQRALQSKYELDQVEYDTQKWVIEAKAEAEATLKRAEAEAKAYEMKRKQISDEIIRIEFINKWDGKMPQVMLSSDQEMLYSLDNIIN
ncbi:prohibitin family protein, partial [Candidatus Woesearchaeota archaeon]|nr:prohibitin family protein [Candidatus Woesearchaeota archaeon]